MKKRGRKVGKPRFKSEHRFKTFTYNQSGFKLLPKNDKFGLLHLSKIGDIPIRLHRPIEGEIKQVTIKHMPSGKWYAYIIVDNGSSDFELIDIETAVGLDVGLTSYIVDSDGHEVENPRHLKQALKKLRREQRRLSKKQKGSNNREKQRIIVARHYERVQNQTKRLSAQGVERVRQQLRPHRDREVTTKQHGQEPQAGKKHIRCCLELAEPETSLQS